MPMFSAPSRTATGGAAPAIKPTTGRAAFPFGALGALIGGVVLALTDDYLPVFHVLGALLACGAIGLSLVFRSAESSAIVDSGAPLWSE